MTAKFQPDRPVLCGFRANRSPKGNMWSAIPVALLCMIVNWIKGKQGSGLEGDEVVKNTGDFRLFVRPSLHPSVRPTPPRPSLA